MPNDSPIPAVATSWPCAVSIATRTVRYAAAVPLSGCVKLTRPSRSSATSTAWTAAPTCASSDATRSGVAACQQLEHVAPQPALRQQASLPGFGDPRVRSLSIHARGGIAVAIASPTPQA